MLPECSDSETADEVGGSQKCLPETVCVLAAISFVEKKKESS